MIGIEKHKIETEGITPDGTYGKFIVEPLERGYGTTLGNSLRRVLLSSLPGYAIISVKIDGILHEFSTIPGVKEDVTEIVLNLKDVILKIHGDGPKTVYIDASGECEITAGSIQTDSEVEISTRIFILPLLTAARMSTWSSSATRAEAIIRPSAIRRSSRPL